MPDALLLLYLCFLSFGFHGPFSSSEERDPTGGDLCQSDVRCCRPGSSFIPWNHRDLFYQRRQRTRRCRCCAAVLGFLEETTRIFSHDKGESFLRGEFPDPSVCTGVCRNPDSFIPAKGLPGGVRRSVQREKGQI